MPSDRDIYLSIIATTHFALGEIKHMLWSIMDWLIETDCLKGQPGGSILSILPFRFYGSMRSWSIWEAQPGHSQVKQIQQILVLLLLEHCPSAIHWWEGVAPNSDFYWPFEPTE